MTDQATLNRCLAFVEAEVGQRRPHGRPLPITITFSRTTGSGGIPVAEHLATYLQKHRPAAPSPWTVFHRTLVERVLAEHNLPAKLAQFMPEDRTSYIQTTMEELLGLHPSAEEMTLKVTETILGLAEVGHCIIIGRAANVILQKSPAAFHVRVVSALDKRTQRVQADKSLDAQAAREFILHEDSARARYVKTYFNADIADPLAYHLVLNTDLFPVDEAAEIIGQAVLRHFPAPNR